MSDARKWPPVEAIGGTGKLEHLIAVLTEAKADAVRAASIFHLGEYKVEDESGRKLN